MSWPTWKDVFVWFWIIYAILFIRYLKNQENRILELKKNCHELENLVQDLLNQLQDMNRTNEITNHFNDQVIEDQVNRKQDNPILELKKSYQELENLLQDLNMNRTNDITNHSDDRVIQVQMNRFLDLVNRIEYLRNNINLDIKLSYFFFVVYVMGMLLPCLFWAFDI